MEDFVDVSKESHSNVWKKFFLWNRKDEKAKCKTCDTVLKCKKSSTKSLFEHFKRIHSKEIGKEKESLPIQASSKRPQNLERLYNALITIPPTSIESERNFSTTSFFGTKLRSRLDDITLSALVFLKSYYKKKKERSVSL